MSRLWTCGFELQSTDPGVEFETSSGNVSIDTSVVRSGSASLRCDANGTPAYVDHYVTSSDTAHLKVRAYIRLREYPNATTPIILAVDSVFVGTASIRVTSSGRLQLFDQLTQVGGESDVLSLDTWYMVDLWTKSNDVGDQGAVARLNGTTFATDTVLSGGSRWMMLRFGVAPSSANTSPTLDINFDDIAVNDAAGTFQTGYPGEGSVVHLMPDSVSDSDEWVGIGTATNYANVNELPPNDATDYNQATTTGIHTDLFGLQLPSSKGIGGSDTVNLVQVGVRAGATSATAGSRAIKLLLKNGSTLQSSEFFINVNGWITNRVSAPYVYNLTAYKTPSGANWDAASLFSTQIGYENTISSTNARRVSTLWALVEYVPNSAEDYASTATHATEVSGTTEGSSSTERSSDGATEASGTAASSKDVAKSASEGTTTSGQTSNTSTRSTSASVEIDADGSAFGYQGLPPAVAENASTVTSEASGTTSRVASASLSTEADTASEFTRNSLGSASQDADASGDSYGTKTAQPAVLDSSRMTGLVGSDKDEDLIFPLQLHVEIQMPDLEWIDITGDVRATESVKISRGRANEASHPDASTLNFKLNNRHGKYSPRNPNSEFYRKIGRNTPIRVYVTQGDLAMYRFYGEIYSFPSKWDISDTDVWINIEASGILRRLQQGSQPLQSALSRYMMTQSPVTYYPLTNGKESGFRANAAIGSGSFSWYIRTGSINGLALTAPLWQGGELTPWLEPVVKVPDSRIGVAKGPVDAGSGNSWCVDFIRSGISGQDSFIVRTADGDTNDMWILGELQTDPLSLFLTIRTSTEDSSAATLLFENWTPNGLFSDEPHHIRLKVTEDGASNLDWEVIVDGEYTQSGSLVTPARPVVNIDYEWWRPNDATQGQLSFGHIAVYNQDSAPSEADVIKAMKGYPGEKSGRRIERICTENGIELDINGNLDDTPRMGPQRIEDILTTLRQAADVDGGILHESRVRNALLYRTNRSRYNQEGL